MSTSAWSSSSIVGDRFIPVRAAIDFDFPLRKEKERNGPSLYRTLLYRTLFGNRTRMRPASEDGDGEYLGFSSSHCRPKKPVRHVPDRMLDAPKLVDDRNLNLLDWGSSALLSIALGERVHFWNSSSSAPVPGVIEVAEPVTSICWAPDGERIVIGLRNSEVQLWDVMHSTLLRTLRRVHGSPVGALAWNNESILTTGGGDGKVVNHDVRVSESQVVGTFEGHVKEICSVKWSGRQLATGANDNVVHIWDLASNRSKNRWVHKFTDHKGGGIRALALCPLQRNLLATGGGGADRCIKFWSTSTGSCLSSVDVGSEVCALLWNERKMELLSSCGDGQSPLTARDYPSMVETATLSGHIGRVLYMAQSPDGCTVATASGGVDESLILWKMLGLRRSAPPSTGHRMEYPLRIACQ